MMSIQRNTALALTLAAVCGASFCAKVGAQPALGAPAATHARAARPPRTAKIAGRVVDENGQPVGGLNLRAVISSEDFARLTMPLWTQIKLEGVVGYGYSGPPPEDRIGRSMVDTQSGTRPDGTYVFDGLTSGRYFLMDGGNFLMGGALKPAQVTSPTSVQTHEGETVQAPDIVVSRGVLLRGQVLDQATGAPLAGLELRYFDVVHPPEIEWLSNAFRNGRRPLVTDANGRFEVRVAPGAAAFFIAGRGWSFNATELALSPRQAALWPPSAVKNPQLWAVKSGQAFYASDLWVQFSDDGGPPRELTHAQWARVTVAPQHDKALLFRLEKLTFKDGKPPRFPNLSTVSEGDPRK